MENINNNGQNIDNNEKYRQLWANADNNGE